MCLQQLGRSALKRSCARARPTSYVLHTFTLLYGPHTCCGATSQCSQGLAYAGYAACASDLSSSAESLLPASMCYSHPQLGYPLCIMLCMSCCACHAGRSLLPTFLPNLACMSLTSGSWRAMARQLHVRMRTQTACSHEACP